MPETTTDTRALRHSPAEGLHAAMAAGSCAAARLREVPFAVMTALRVVPGTAAANAVEQVLGCPLPARVGEVGTAGERSVLWLGPSEYLTWAPDGSADPAAAAQEIDAALTAAQERSWGQAVDVSAHRTTLELSGPRAQEVMEKSIALDVHLRAWPAGRCYSTLLCGIPVTIHRTDEDTFRLLARSSYAAFLVTWLLDAMSEYL